MRELVVRFVGINPDGDAREYLTKRGVTVTDSPQAPILVVGDNNIEYAYEILERGTDKQVIVLTDRQVTNLQHAGASAYPQPPEELKGAALGFYLFAAIQFSCLRRAFARIDAT